MNTNFVEDDDQSFSLKKKIYSKITKEKKS